MNRVPESLQTDPAPHQIKVHSRFAKSARQKRRQANAGVESNATAVVAG
jgi:hypothetical protein